MIIRSFSTQYRLKSNHKKRRPKPARQAIPFYRSRSLIQYMVSLCQVLLCRRQPGSSEKRRSKAPMALVAVSRFECRPSEGFTQHSGAFIGRRRCEPSQNPSVRVRVIGALANLSHLGTTVTIEELPMRRVKDITFAFLLPEAFPGKLFSLQRSGRPPVASPENSIGLQGALGRGPRW
jgi:hypothetical protein